jgi:hypothetical protein
MSLGVSPIRVGCRESFCGCAQTRMLYQILSFRVARMLQRDILRIASLCAPWSTSVNENGRPCLLIDGRFYMSTWCLRIKDRSCNFF